MPPITPYDKLKIRKSVMTFPDLFQENHVGASATDSERGWFDNLFALSGGSNYIYDWLIIGPYLYMVGNFTTASGSTRKSCACLDLRDGSLTDWNPNFDVASPSIFSIATDGTYIYLGGTFTGIESQTFNRICRVNKKTGAVDATWNPGIDNGGVNKIIIDNTNVYVLGTFTAVNSGTTRNRSALFLTTSETVQASFNLNCNGSVENAYLDEDNQIMYVTGGFTSVSATTRNYGAAWDISGDTLGAFNPNLNATGYVIKTTSDNATVWIGGNFTTVNGGTARVYLASFNTTGTVVSSNFALNSYVNDISFDSDERFIYFGGNFTSVLSTTRNRLAQIDLNTEALGPWNPNANGIIYSLFRYQNTFYISGNYTTINGESHTNNWNLPHILFDDSSCLFVDAVNGDDTNLGTEAAPFKTIGKVSETSFTLNDSSGNGYNLSETGTIGILTTKHCFNPVNGNHALGPFNDSNYATVPAGVGNAINTAGAITFECDIRMDVISNSPTFFNYNDSGGGVHYLQILPTGVLRWSNNGNALDTAAGVITNFKWYNIRVTASAAGRNIYVDEVSKASDAFALTLNTHTTHYLGRYSGAGFSFHGNMDQIRYYASVETSFPATGTVLAKYDFDTVPAEIGKDYVVVNTGTYNEQVYMSRFSESTLRGLIAGYGQLPVVERSRGAVNGTYGARVVGREKFSTGAAATFYYVSKNGNDSTGARGNSALPFKTIQAALSDGSRVANDTIQIQDNGVYIETLNIAALDVIIQAATGKVPTIKDCVLTGVATTQVEFYGIYFLYDFSSTLNLYNALSQSSPVFYDCTIENAIINTTATASSTISYLINCNLLSTDVLIDSGGLEINNCFVDGTKTTSGIDTNITDGSISINQSTFLDIQTVFRFEILGTTNNTFINVINSYIEGINIQAPSIDLLKQSDNTLGTYYYLENTHISNTFGIYAYITDKSSWTLTSYASCTIKNNLFDGLIGRVYLFGQGVDAGLGLHVNGLYLIENNAFLNCSDVGIAMDWIIYCDVKNNSFLNPGSYAIEEIGSVGAPAIVGYIRNNALNTGGISASGPTETGNDETAIFVSETDGSENLALSLSSPGTYFVLDDNTPRNSGLINALITIINSNFLINDFYVKGPLNREAGIDLKGTFDAPQIAEYCTAEILGPYSFYAGVDAIYRYCKVFESSGNAFMIAGNNSQLLYSVGSKGTAGGAVTGLQSPIIQNVSIEGFEYAQWDKKTTNGNNLINNILTGSGVSDYFGRAIQQYSDIPLLSENAGVDSNSIRKDPIFRDRANYDLRLQTIDAEFYYNSPAKQAGNDGYDMGAFKFHYGDSEDTVSILVDFTATGYRNPDNVERIHFHVRLVEDEREDATLRSKSLGVKRRWVLTWVNVQQMPTAQREGLLSLYSLVNADVEVSFDGGSTWIEVTIVRGEEFTYQEITEEYWDASLPMPLRTLILREK